MRKGILKSITAIVLAGSFLFIACGKEKVIEDSHKASFIYEGKELEYLNAKKRANIELDDATKSKLINFCYSTNKEMYKAYGTEGDYIYSPVSLYLALCLCEDIADETRSADLMQMLGADSKEELEGFVESFIKSISSDADGEICKVANSIWMANDLKKTDKTDEICNNAAEKMFAELYGVDFSDPATKKMIDEWVAKKTDGLIKEAPKAPTEADRIILFNTLLFEKKWKAVFDKNSISNETFEGKNNPAKEIEMIHYHGEHERYVETEHAMAGAISYADDSYMIFIDSKERNQIDTIMDSELEEIINAYQNYNDSTYADYLHITFPRVCKEFKLPSMIEQLSKLGVSSIFNDGAFGTLSEEALVVSEIAQKCKVIIDETGTKAAAVTEIIMKETAIFVEDEPIIVNIDLNDPYIYVIMSANDVPLFIGVVNDL